MYGAVRKSCPASLDDKLSNRFPASPVEASEILFWVILENHKMRNCNHLFKILRAIVRIMKTNISTRVAIELRPYVYCVTNA